MLKTLIIMLLALPLLSGCSNASLTHSAPDALEPLIEAMAQRLDIANDVAQSKWHSGKPVQDSERERQVILNAESQAHDFNLSPDDVRPFMTAQMEANKKVQYARIAQWHVSGQAPAKPTASLTQGIRARLDTLQPVLMQKYAAFLPYRQDSACRSWVQAEINRQMTDPVIASALQLAAGNLCTGTPKA